VIKTGMAQSRPRRMDFESRPLIIPTPTRKPVFLLHAVDAEVLPFCLRLTTF
jgi:hypothetical protein